MGRVQSIYRYPIKGMTGQSLPAALLEPGKPIAGDRAYAIALCDTGFDPAEPRHLSKTRFLVLMTHPGLARLRAEFTGDGRHVTLSANGEGLLTADLDDPAGAAALAALAARYGEKLRGPPRLVTAPDHMFADIPDRHLSLINLASVEALSGVVGAALDPLRFRGNLTLSGLAPWAEKEWQPGQNIRVGSTRLRVVKPIIRCAATAVNPQTGEVDFNLPLTLRREFGAPVMGVYAAIIKGGEIRPGDAVEALPPEKEGIRHEP